MENSFPLVLPLTKSFGIWVEMKGKWGEAKQKHKNMSVESLCSLVGMNSFFCFLGFFFVCVFYFYISKILL